MSPALGAAGACVQRVDHGDGQPLTLAQAIEAVQHPLAALKRSDLEEVVAYLCCQVVGYAHRQDAAANLAMTQITGIVREYQRKGGGT